jgi:hypothetical protein
MQITQSSFAFTRWIQRCYTPFTFREHSNRGKRPVIKREPDMKQHPRHTAATNGRRNATHLDRRLRAFLTGDSDGNDLLDALYSHVLDEPIPDRLLAILRR